MPGEENTDETTDETEGAEQGSGTPTPPPAPPAENDLAARLAAIEAREARQDRATLMTQALGRDNVAGYGSFFAEHYQGELTLDAIQTAAKSIGLEVADPNAYDPNAVSGFQAMRDLGAGAMPVGSEPGKHPIERANEEAKAARDRGTEGDALAAWVDSQARSVLHGDRRMLIDVHAQRRLMLAAEEAAARY